MTDDVTDVAVRFDAVSKQFGADITALQDVSLTVRRGEIVVLLGLSGSGKSTLLRHIDGLHRPTSGSVTVLGTDVGRAAGSELRRLRRRVGFVFQQFHLVGSLSVLENVCSGALGRLRIAPLFAGVRGEPPMDADALCDAVVKIGELMLDPAARVMSLDLNPVLLDSAGKGCLVVDAVVFQGVI